MWGIVVLVGVFIVAASLLWARAGKADWAARRKLGQLREAEKRSVNTATIRERRGDMVWLSHLPGNKPVPSTIDPDAHNPARRFRR